MKFSKTQLITLVGIVLAIVAAVLAALGKTTATLFFLAATLLVLMSITAVIHRYLVSTRAATNRQFEKVRKIIDEQGELKTIALSETVTAAADAGKTTPTGNKSKEAGQARAAVPKKRKTAEVKTAEVKPTSIPPLQSPMISVNDREAEVARSIAKDPKAASRFALKVKSRNIRNNFARAASGNFYTYEEVISILRQLREGDTSDFETVKGWDAKALIALANVLGNQRLIETDLEDARTILVVVAAVFGQNSLDKEDRLFLSEIVGECGDWETAAYILEALGLKKSNPAQYHFTVANQFAGRSGQTSGWLNAVNWVYRANGFSQLSFKQGDVTDIDQLQADTLPADTSPDSQPLVSIIVPTFEGASRIRTALRSLVAQSWENLEILVVDDGSSRANVSALESIVADYPAVQLVLLEENSGAYIARNEGLRLAKGEFITVHDDDDWSHPQKIARQVEYLQKNPDLVGTISKHARVTEDLKFTRINRRPEFSQNNMSSLLLRTQDARALGGWNEVNRGADEEFTLRLQKVTGKKIGCCSETPLSFTRTHSHSLTSGEILRGFQNPSRMLYHSAFTSAHLGIDAENVKPEILALPADMGRGKRGTDFGTFDFGYVFDTKLDNLNQASALAELRHLDDLGYRVAIVHHHSFEGSAIPLVSHGVLKLLEETGVQFLSFQNVAHFRFLIVRDPRAFEFAEDTATSVTAEELALVTVGAGESNQSQPALTGKALFALGQVFGQRESDICVLDDWMGLTPFGPRQTHFLKAESKPVVGRGRASSSKKWPSKASGIKAVYGRNELYEVLLVDDFDKSSERIETVLKQGAEFVPVDSYDFQDFTSKIDFWVDMGETHSKRSVELLSAVAAGLVVLIRPGAEDLYGDSVLYVNPEGVQTVVKRMVDFPELYELQQERGAQCLPGLWSPATFETYIEKLREK